MGNFVFHLTVQLTRLSLLLLIAYLAVNSSLQAAQVNIYSARKEALIKPILDQFTVKMGITVNLVTGKADVLLTRLKSEGRNTPADVLITVDAGRLHRAKQAGVIRAIHSSQLNAAIPANYRDPEGYWYGLSIRARPIFFVKGQANAAELSTYEALADTKWRTQICIRSSDNIYNQSLVASMIASLGVDRTQQWADGFVKNFARAPVGGDRDQIKAAAAGLCKIAIVNTYYYARMLQSKDASQRQAASKVAIFWPDQNGRGTHVNISGAAVTKHAKHVNEAIQLLEFLVSPKAQQWYASVNYEYPVYPDVPASELLRSWGEFKSDQLNLHKLGANNAQAVKIMDRAGWQ